MCCTYLKELRRWNCATAFLAPCDHVLREKCLLADEEKKEEEEADRQKENINGHDNNYSVRKCDKKICHANLISVVASGSILLD